MVELSVRTQILRTTVRGLLADRAQSDPDRLYCIDAERSVCVGELDAEVSRVAAHLAELGVGRGARVMLGLPNSMPHISVLFALLELGALWVPLNVRLRGAPLEHVIDDCAATHVIVRVGSESEDAVHRALAAKRAPFEQQSLGGLGEAYGGIGVVTPSRPEATPDVESGTCAVLYTSGTTGPAKGVQVTDRMLLASALGCVEAAGPVPGDRMYLWEPVYHIGGAQVLLLPLFADVSIAMAKGFSASRFWTDVAHLDATHIHYLGGILQMLLNQPPSPAEQRHRVRVGWGAGATPSIWAQCERRFGITLRECYGMTETSSVVTVNRDGPEFGAGLPLPWFELRLDGGDDGVRGAGEILVRGTLPGLVTPGYLNNPAATSKAAAGEWWRTGDLGRVAETNHLHFAGRSSDSIRRRGENVSAWEVENVFAVHPNVAQCAAVGVAAEVGEQEIKLFVAPEGDRAVDPHELVRWARERLADFQLPRYVELVGELPLTPSRRVAKGQLSRTVDAAIDLHDAASQGKPAS
ncbi:MAG: AMP-binding protein [Streptosporangiales bacterium]|nr:AMP-binding protein [Streptosporangiales bacterium]